MEVFLYMPAVDHGRRLQRMTLEAVCGAEPRAQRMRNRLEPALEAGEIVEFAGSKTHIIRMMKATWPASCVPGAVMRAMLKEPASIVLRGLGEVAGKPADELEVGDIVSWNNAPEAARIAAITRRSDHNIWVVERYADGREFTRRFKRRRIVAATSPGGNPDRRQIIRLDEAVSDR